jgi:hypothetical protein
MTAQVLASDVHLFAPRPAYRFRPITAPSTPYDDPTVGENPPYGATINYYLKGPPSGAVRVAILDQKGEVVRTLAGTANAGLNRITWDLRYEPTNQIRMRTAPLAHAPHVRLGPDGWRAPAGGGASISILAPPGTYTVRLSAAGRDLTAALTVRKDPNTAGTDSDIEAQTRVLFDLRQDLNTAVDLVNRVEIARSQLETLPRLTDDASIRKAAGDLNQKFIDLEMNLIELRLTGAQDGVRYAAKLISRFGYLANGMSNADFRPTNQHLEVQKLLAERLRAQLSQFDALTAKDMAAFNETLTKRNLPHIVVPAQGATPRGTR